MSDLSDLYQEVILDHNRQPRNYGVLAPAGRTAQGHNPLCGDRLTIYVNTNGDRITEIRFEGSGCAISKASASLMTEAVKGLTIEEALSVFERFQAMVTSPLEVPAGDRSLGKLEVLGGVREFPVRIKCASLPWHTLKAALVTPGATAVTE
jgi:nitrogen fixation NifU-like protein